MIAVIAFALFAFIIGDLFSSGFNTTSKDVVMEKIFHLKILESKWAMLKSGQGITPRLPQIEFGIRKYPLLC
jgi:peptidyl-prolyl cis-trans isomerase D